VKETSYYNNNTGSSCPTFKPRSGLLSLEKMFGFGSKQSSMVLLQLWTQTMHVTT